MDYGKILEAIAEGLSTKSGINLTKEELIEAINDIIDDSELFDYNWNFKDDTY